MTLLLIETGDRVASLRARQRTLVEEASRRGLAVLGTAHWFELRGWTFQWRLQTRCGTCSIRLEEYRRPYVTGGRLYRHWAIACRECRSAWHLDEFDAASRRTIRRESAELRARTLETAPAFVYVVRLALPEAQDGFYVGQTSRLPEERFAQHLAGIKSSKWVREYGVKLEHDIVARYNPTLNHESRFLEAAVYDSLGADGTTVHGGH